MWSCSRRSCRRSWTRRRHGTATAMWSPSSQPRSKTARPRARRKKPDAAHAESDTQLTSRRGAVCGGRRKSTRTRLS
eukprot:2497755-Rhodomonas_salina.2